MYIYVSLSIACAHTDIFPFEIRVMLCMRVKIAFLFPASQKPAASNADTSSLVVLSAFQNRSHVQRMLFASNCNTT